MTGDRFRDREDAGTQLAELVADLEPYDPVVLALPRGGVAVGAAVARRLGAPLDVVVARKVGAPGQPELGIGAVAEDGAVVVDRSATTALGIDDERVATLVRRTRREVARRVALYRGDRPVPPLDGRDAVLVDDGLATGVTAAAALHAVRAHRPRRLVLAVPVTAPDTADRLAELCDAVVYLCAPEYFRAVGAWYDDFTQVTDAEVLELLAEADDLDGQGHARREPPDGHRDATDEPPDGHGLTSDGPPADGPAGTTDRITAADPAEGADAVAEAGTPEPA
ncbi:MAG TPA: phosphoribosyltransferase family protein [Acidimicrobiales bacterium]|nr:phosphoribosyltransferase family protein [Acidimicrobiales bacterium]